MLPYWDAYYFDLALAHEATRVHGAQPSSHQGTAARHLAIWLFCVTALLVSLEILARLIG